MQHPLSRRHLLAAGLASLTGLRNAKASVVQLKNPICVFNKPLQHMSYEQQAELVAELGLVGIEGTVRRHGHVEPEHVERDLPRQIAALKKNGVEMTLMTTDVNEADSEIHRRVLKVAADQGVTRFRMGSIKYDRKQPIPRQLEQIKQRFERLVSFCKPLGIQPLYQNHSGANRFGAPLWDLYQVLKNFDPQQVAAAFDIRHATVEGGLSWPTEFQLMRPYFGMVYCKDFRWEQGKSRPYNVPLGTGRVNYPQFLGMLKSSGYEGPISLHMEYIDHREPMLLNDSIQAIKTDLNSLRGLMSAT